MPSLHLTARDLALLQRIIERLNAPQDATSLRRELGEDLLRLLHADQFASYVWNPERRVFEQAVFLNMSADNLARYESYYQYRDPITPHLQRRRRATPVQTVMPQTSLEKTEFFNDFLARDGLHHGINVYAWDAKRNTGDLRIWRRRGRREFDARDITLLEFIKPHFRNAMRNAHLPPDIVNHPLDRMCLDDWDALPLPCFLFHLDGRLRHQNRCGAALLLGCAEPARSVLCQSLADYACAPETAPVDRASGYTFSRIVVRDAAAVPMIAVLLHRTSTAPIDAESLRQRFRLTPRESQIALLAAKGLTDRDLARVLCIGFATVRTHIDAILRKTGASNRAELAHALFADQLPLLLR